MQTFSWPVRVYYEDTDSGGVVYYANYLRFLERARTEWLRARGVEQDRLLRDEGVIFAVRTVHVEYLKPARFNDLLDVTADVSERGRASLSFTQHILRAQAGVNSGAGVDNTLCAAKVRIACLDAASLRPRPIPKNVLAEMYRDH